MWKLRLWISNLPNYFLQETPEEYLAVNEIMVPFKGQSIMRQCMLDKPQKWGFKIWGRSGVNGCLHDFDIYQVKTTERDTNNLETSANGYNFKLFADNFFSSLPLIQKLKKTQDIVCWHYSALQVLIIIA